MIYRSRFPVYDNWEIGLQENFKTIVEQYSSKFLIPSISFLFLTKNSENAIKIHENFDCI